MAGELAAGGTNLLDVLDRVLDKGIVIDAWMRLSLAGLDLVEIESRIVVASINTYLTDARALAGARVVSPPLSIEPGFPGTKRRATRLILPVRRSAA